MSEAHTQLEYISLNKTIPQIIPPIVTIYPVWLANTGPVLLIKKMKVELIGTMRLLK